MSLAAFFARCWESRRLLSLMLELTYACDLRCEFCYNEKERAGERLTLDDYRRILGQAREEGALFLTLTGGEPTLHPDFFAIGAHADGLGYSVRIKSNGHAFTAELVGRLKDEIHPYNIDLSLHGASACVHDGTTGVPGSFDRLLRTVGLLKEAGIRVRFKLPLTRQNEAELEDIFDLARSLEVSLDAFPDLTPKDDGDLSPVTRIATLGGIHKLYKLLNDRAGPAEEAFGSAEETDKMTIETPFACGAGLSNLMVDPFGTAFSCVAWRDPMGDLKKESVIDIWRGEAAARIAETNREAGCRKQANPDLEGELFCPGRAYIQYGSPLTIYPESVMLARLNRLAKKSIKKE